MIPVVSLNQVNSKLTCELETIKQKLNISESELKELTAEKVMNYKQITDLEAGCSKLIREKEELRKMNEGQREELTEMTEKCSQLRLDSDQTHVLLRLSFYYEQCKLVELSLYFTLHETFFSPGNLWKFWS